MTILLETLAEKKERIEEALPMTIENLDAPSSLKEAMLYSLLAGGKRVRPLLTLVTVEAFKRDADVAIKLACAIEMLHTYSLIHDDLPSMDDDDFRRGNLTNHKVYGEALAILAGDGLLTYCFEVIASIEDPSISAEIKLDLILMLAKAAGPEGMVAGQVVDLEGEQKSLTIQELEYIHNRKTGKLLAFSIVSGAIIGGATEEQLAHLEKFATHLGLAFQIQDDILDIEGDQEKLGKPVGSDLQNDKSTYPKLLSMEGAKFKLSEELLLAKEHLYKAKIDHEILEQFADFIVTRDH